MKESVKSMIFSCPDAIAPCKCLSSPLYNLGDKDPGGLQVGSGKFNDPFHSLVLSQFNADVEKLVQDIVGKPYFPGSLVAGIFDVFVDFHYFLFPRLT
ncbi:MAG: hypothetical protein WC637_07985 [Victivallales bacterium]